MSENSRLAQWQVQAGSTTKFCSPYTGRQIILTSAQSQLWAGVTVPVRVQMTGNSEVIQWRSQSSYPRLGGGQSSIQDENKPLSPGNDEQEWGVCES